MMGWGVTDLGAILSPPIKDSPQQDKNCFSDSMNITSLREAFRPTERADLGPQKNIAIEDAAKRKHALTELEDVVCVTTCFKIGPSTLRPPRFSHALQVLTAENRLATVFSLE